MTDDAQSRRGVHVPVAVLVVVGGIVLFVLAFAIGRRTGDGDEGRFGSTAGHGHAGAGIGRLLALLVIVGLVAWGIWALVRHYGRADDGPRSDIDGALAVLAGRLARGEIDEAEYRRRRDALTS